MLAQGRGCEASWLEAELESGPTTAGTVVVCSCCNPKSRDEDDNENGSFNCDLEMEMCEDDGDDGGAIVRKNTSKSH